MLSSPADLERAKRDGCGCHPNTVCRHVDGVTLMLTDVQKTICRESITRAVRYAVTGPRVPFVCACGYDRIMSPDLAPDPDAFYSSDLSTAEAEFDKRAEELLA